MLEVVQQQQHFTTAQRVLEVVGSVGHADRGGDRRRDQVRLRERSEVDERRPVLEVGLQRGSHLERHPRLARAAGAGEREQSHVGAPQQRGGRSHLEAATDERRRGRRESRGTWPGRRGRSVKGRVVAEDRGLELHELRARIDAELVDERSPCVPVCGERIRLTPAPVQGEHLQPAQPLAVAILARQRLELADQLRVPSQRQVGVDALLQRGEPPLLQTRRLPLGEGCVGDVRKCRPVPERQRIAQGRRRGRGLGTAGPLDELDEALQIELAGLHADQVARAPGDHPVGPERLAQGVHADLQGVRGRGWQGYAPEAVDQPIPGHEPVSGEQQHCQHRALAWAAERQPSAVSSSGLDWPEDGERDRRTRWSRHGSPRSVASQRMVSGRRQSG